MSDRDAVKVTLSGDITCRFTETLYMSRSAFRELEEAVDSGGHSAVEAVSDRIQWGDITPSDVSVDELEIDEESES